MNALTPPTYDSIWPRPGRGRVPRARRRAAETDGAEKAILRQRVGAEHLRQPAEPDAPLQFHLP